ncbi:MAG: questin oxidase family protein [Taibaiella sp.]|jgi:hypothetical protein
MTDAIQKEISRVNLVNTLLNDQSYHIEFNGHLTNHNKHAVVALHGLGASEERIKSYYEAYAFKTPYGYGLEAPKSSKHVISLENWKTYLGKRTSYSSYYQFFDSQEKKLGMDALIKEYLPTLLPGWVGSLMHGTIHLGWALDIGNRCMTIEGLAYMAFSHVSCHPEKIISDPNNHDHLRNKSAIDTLLFISNIWDENSIALKNWVEILIAENDSSVTSCIHPELVRSGLQYRIARLLAEGHPQIYMIPRWLETQSIHNIWEQLDYATTLVYLAYPSDFLVLHLITSLHAMKQFSNYLPSDQQKYVAQCYWVGMLCILFSRGEFPSKRVLETLEARYKDTFDNMHTDEPSWENIISKALQEEEEHNPKMVYVLQRIWKEYNHRSIFRVAASHFTVTPELPKSFELPPTE